MLITDSILPFDVSLFIISIICFIVLEKRKKLVISLPLVLNLFFISYYNFIDDILMEYKYKLSPYGGTYNLDYTRPIISSIMVLIMLFFSIYLSKKIGSRKLKIIYIAGILLFNSLLAYVSYRFHLSAWMT